MSRITESLRRLIKEEVQKSLRRKLREEADVGEAAGGYPTSEETDTVFEKIGSNGGYDQYYDAETDTSYIYDTVGEDKNKFFYVAGDLRIESFQSEDWIEVSADDYQSVLEAMQAADDATPATPAAVEPAKEDSVKSGSAKRRRVPQDIVKQIQTALGMTGADVNGIWGPKTDDAWVKWLDAHNNITFTNNKNIEDLKTSWAKNSKYIKEINNSGKMDTSSGTVENMLEFIKYAEMEAVRSPGSQPVASTPTAETKPMKVVAQGYNEIIAYANAQAIEALRIGDEALHDEWQAHADSVRTRHSQDTVIKSVAAASAKLDKELAFLKEIDPDDTFEFSDSALASTQTDAADDAADSKAAISESRWMRLAGLLKG